MRAVKKLRKPQVTLPVDLDLIESRILSMLNEKLDSTAESVREELKRNVEVLRGCLEAASKLVPQIDLESSKPSYVQVGECVAERLYGGGPEAMKLPITEMRGYYQNQCLNVSRGASDTVRSIATALSGRDGESLEAGRYRYAILLFKLEEKEKSE